MSDDELVLTVDDGYENVQILEDEFEELLADTPEDPERLFRYEPDTKSRLGQRVAEHGTNVKSRLGPLVVPGLLEEDSQMPDQTEQVDCLPSVGAAELSEMEKLDQREEKRKRKIEAKKERDMAVLALCGTRIRKREPVAGMIKYPNCGPPPSDSENSDLEDDGWSPVWKNKKPKIARVDSSWDDLFHGERTAREHSDYHMALNTPILMPTLTMTQARKKLLKSGPYYAKKVPDQDYKEFRAGFPVFDTQRDVKRFVDEVERWHMCSFDTEGNGQLPYIPPEEEDGRVLACYGSPITGSVLVFHDVRDTPESIRHILSEYRYAKIQSGIHLDVHLLAKQGIKVRGIVDSGTLMAFVNPKSTSYGAAAQIAAIWGPEPENTQKWLFRFMAEYKRQRLSMENLRHSIQDVLTPFAVVIQAALMEAGQRLYGDEDDIFPIMNEAIELCYSKSPADIRHATDGMMKPETFRNFHPQQLDTKFGLNSRLRCQTIRRARGDFVERFEDRKNHRAETYENKVACAKLIWPTADLPNSNDFRWANLFIRMANRCQNCGNKKHSRERCTDQLRGCVYPHGPGNQDHPAHSTLMCPVLHTACLECKVRGHTATDHAQNMQQSPLQLRQTFLEFAHEGLITCVPFLYTDRQLKPYHWGACLGYSRLARNVQDLWLYAGVRARLMEEQLEAGKPAREQSERNLTSTIMNYEPYRAERDN